MTLWLDRADHLLLESELLVTGIRAGGPDVHLMIQQNVGDYHAKASSFRGPRGCTVR